MTIIKDKIIAEDLFNAGLDELASFKADSLEIEILRLEADSQEAMASGDYDLLDHLWRQIFYRTQDQRKARAA